MTSAVRAAPLARPVWSRLRWWLLVAVVIVLGAVAVATVSGAPDRPLDPDSATHDGAKAIAQLLREHGVAVHRADNVAGARGAIIVPFPDTLSGAELASLRRRAGVLVLLSPSRTSLPGWRLGRPRSGVTEPGCSWSGAAAGPVDLPSGTDSWTAPGPGAVRCYGGAYVRESMQGSGVVVLGSSALLRNDHLADRGVAALAVNALTDSGRMRSVTWITGLDNVGQPTRSVWQLFPGGVERVTVWLLVVVGLLLALWRGRRFGPVVEEPLPVVVRAIELVEGHGRLYRRAGARDRAASALRAGTLARLIVRLGLPRTSTAPDVVAIASSATRLPQAQVADALCGAAPVSDAEMVALARRLADLERAVGASADSMSP